MEREPSSGTTHGKWAVQLIVLVAILAVVGWLLQSASRTEAFALPMVRGRTLLEWLYQAFGGAFWIYAGIYTLRPDVARDWAERAAAQARFWATVTQDRKLVASAEERLPMCKRVAKLFAVVWFVIGALVLARVAVMFFGGVPSPD